MSRVPYPFTAIRTDDDDTGKNVVPFASVAAKDAAGAPADVYDAETGGSPYSTFILDSNGTKQIWVEPGIYQFSVAGGTYFSVFASSATTEDFTSDEKTRLSRSFYADDAINDSLPNAAGRANKFLTFGAGGDPVLASYSSVRTLLNVDYGATANETDEFLLDRANHEGTQPQSTVEGLEDAIEISVNTVDAQTISGDKTFSGDVTLESQNESKWRGFFDEDGNLILGFDRHTGLSRLYPDQQTTDLIANYPDPLYMPQRMRSISQMFSAINNGATERPIWVAIGDSWTQAYRHYIEETIARLGNNYGFTGHGWVQLGSTSGLTTDYTIARTGTWTVDSRDELSPSLQSATSSTATDKITVVGFGGETDAVLYGYSGSFRYRFNGGSWTSDSFTGGAVEFKTFTGVPNIPGTPWTCEIEVVSGTLKVFGLDIFNDSLSGIRVSNLGMAGSYTGDWVGIDEGAFVDSLANLGGHLHTVMHGTNDQYLSDALNITPAEYRDNLVIIVNRIRAARPDSDIMLISPPQVRVEGPPTIEYRDAMRSVAIELKCGHLDLMPYFGDEFDEYEYGAGRALLDNTLIHPAQTGGDVIVDAILKFMLGASFPVRA